jgi:hypothetical protein
MRRLNAQMNFRDDGALDFKMRSATAKKCRGPRGFLIYRGFNSDIIHIAYIAQLHVLAIIHLFNHISH